MDFFPYFKLLSKMVHLAMTQRKEMSIVLRQQQAKSNSTKIHADYEMSEKLVEQFHVFATLEKEI
jgi:hypothetical protein